DGCGLCVTGCAEGALKVIDGKARLISEIYCDGLGACLSECPNGALKIIRRNASEFDEKAVEEHLSRQEQAAPSPLQPIPSEHGTLACGCPGSMVQELKPLSQAAPAYQGGPAPSTLRNWPIQLHLVPVKAPFFDQAHILIAADCAGFSLTALHRDYLPGKSLIIACPKLDDTSNYIHKLAELLKNNTIYSLTVAIMQVPCCTGLMHIVQKAVEESGTHIPIKKIVVGIDGAIIS
ncbi:MAG: 4Fe-4S ferredoxin, partial [Acidobacteriota bacterium]